MTADGVREYLMDAGLDDSIIMDDYAPAFCGTTEDGRAVYQYDLMVRALMDGDGMTEEEAAEWIDYNTVRALPYMGDRAPVILYPVIE